ncbi:MAG: zinc ribbon domain-containing protein [Gammaproteobacteria bacterium]|jgi:putative FmdB family regulatory protein|nr:zinc ribbon domain-containing protein [Gammaproteobacteria bacterium]
MPIYEYHCASCGADLEKIQKFSDPVLTDCPSCGKASLKKLVSASSFRLKGSGWYETDFKTKKKSVVGEGNPAESKTTKAPENTGKSDKSEKSSAKKAD